MCFPVVCFTELFCNKNSVFVVARRWEGTASLTRELREMVGGLRDYLATKATKGMQGNRYFFFKVK